MVKFVGAGPGDVELITVKGMKALEAADCVIYAGSLVNEKLLNYCKKEVAVYNSAAMNLDEVIEVMTAMEAQKKTTIRLHTGDPSLFGAIREQMDRLKPLHIEYEVIPGVSSFLGAAASLKEEFTLPGVSQTVIITRLPGRTGTSEGGSLEELAKHKASMAIFLSVQAIEDVVATLLTSYEKETPIAVIYKATWEDQKIVRGTLADIAPKVKEAGITRFAQILVGHFMADEYELSKLYDKSFAHMYRDAK
ncbi:MAG: precorrin-4 C(11)-methyltransferase [Vallitaleaceae bacterium]|nr:precorrin-4 C(11)-methyltransferase [Vallitaleaceae bacterium]